MSGAQCTQDPFVSCVRFRLLEDDLLNPDDTKLLNSLLHSLYLKDHINPMDDKCPDLWVQAICHFALKKAGIWTQSLDMWAADLMRISVDSREEIISDLAFRQLDCHLINREDKRLLHDFLSQYKGYPDEGFWAIWAFAVAKGKESERKWRLDLDASRQILPARSRMWLKLRGWYKSLVLRRKAVGLTGTALTPSQPFMAPTNAESHSRGEPSTKIDNSARGIKLGKEEMPGALPKSSRKRRSKKEEPTDEAVKVLKEGVIHFDGGGDLWYF